MFKYLYTFLIFSFLALPSSILAAENPTNTAAANQTAQDSLTVQVDQFSDLISKEKIDSWIKHNNSLFLSEKNRSEFENQQYCPVNKIFCKLTLTNSQKRFVNLSSQTSVDEAAIKAYVEDLARRVNRDPQDAKFKVSNGVVGTFEEAADGITLDQEKSVGLIVDALKSNSRQNIALPFDSKKSNTNYSDINNMGISSLIGEGTSNFKGSPANRVHNLTVAAAKFNGLLIKPGEEFSFVKNLGVVDDSTGYLPELVIKGNLTEPEFGGGICQVSTTAFRAAIYSGLKITARRNHAYPVSYYNPQGMDSTVYIPNPDLKFVNNTPGYILIQTKIVGTILTFDFYGTDDGRKTTVDGPYITDKQPDGSMKAHFTQNVVDKNGNQLLNEVFNSSYNSPYLYPHPGAIPLSIKPANWSNDQWKSYKQMIKDAANATPVKP